MYQSIFGYRYLNGYLVDIFGWDDVSEKITYEINGKIRTAKRYYTKAAFGHGNPPPGTMLEYYNIILPTGKKVKYKIYAQKGENNDFIMYFDFTACHPCGIAENYKVKEPEHMKKIICGIIAIAIIYFLWDSFIYALDYELTRYCYF